MGIEVVCKVVPIDLVGYPMIAPGLGIGVEAAHPFYQRLLDYYKGIHFWTRMATLTQWIPWSCIRLICWLRTGCKRLTSCSRCAVSGFTLTTSSTR